MSFALVVFSACFAICFTLWFRWRWNVFKTFERIGIPGPKPNFIFGNYIDIYKYGPRDSYLKWMQEYGPLIGVFFGTKPIVLVKDPELQKILQIKEYENFSKRDLYIDGGGIAGGYLKPSLIFGDGKEWKTFRNLLSPFFSTSKMREAIGIWHSTIDNFFDSFDKIPNKEEGVEMFHGMKQITMESIMKVAHSMNMGITKDDHPLFYDSAPLYFTPKFSDFHVAASFVFPELLRANTFIHFLYDWVNFKILSKPSTAYIASYFSELLKYRDPNKKSSSRSDILQKILNARYDQHEENFIKDISKIDKDSVDDVAKLEHNAMISDSIIFLLAGFETTSAILAFLCHEIAKDQECQDKIREEIKIKLKGKNMTHDDFVEMPYLDQVVNEGLRLYPSTPTFVMRRNNFDYTYKGKTFPKDTMFVIPVSTIQIDPEYWPDPMKFDPERFSLENSHNKNTAVYQPFGTGPRNCIGEKYALKIAKVILSRLLKKYKLELLPDSPKDVEIVEHLFIIRPKDGVRVKLTPVEQ